MIGQIERKSGVRLRVDWSHPIARGLLECWHFGPEGWHGLVNLARAGARAIVNAATGVPPYWRANSAGAGLYVPLDNTATNSGAPADYSWRVPDYMNYAAGSVSAFCRFTPQNLESLASAYGFLFGKSGTGSGELSVWMNNVGQHYLYIGTQADSSLYNFPTALQDGQTADYAVTRDFPTITARYYLNGTQLGINTTFSSTGAQPGESMTLGRGPTTNQGFSADYQRLYIWIRTLAPPELEQLHLDPDCFLVPVRPRLFKTPAALAGSVGASAGVGAASATGIGLGAAIGTAAGVGAAAATGTGFVAAVGTAAGVGVAAATGTGFVAAVGAAAGVGAAVAASTGLVAAGTAAGVGAATATGAAVFQAAGAASGIGTASAFSRTSSIALAYGVASGVGNAYSIQVVKQSMWLYGRRSGMMLQGSASQ
jgi:hypothetical protein